ncbi:Manganese lipoxygenase [Colletotrichum sidae]|uniref:Manganese lipoxygenase n=1 Tax=Colletotrichum sidae TaxID=1347389 RepID=A0A4V3I1V6_9PEZI|nr:Manganese lipoxygenase [Colletotrichum sidae]
MILKHFLLVSGGVTTVLGLPGPLPPFSIPTLNDSARTLEIETTRQAFTYGKDDTLVAVDPWPAGSLGKSALDQHYEGYSAEQLRIKQLVERDVADVKAALPSLSLNTFEDYFKLYEGRWKRSVPSGIAEGVLSNSRSDLLFAMERLSVHPESLRRVRTDEPLALQVEDDIARKITTQTQGSLQEQGRLFIVDHSSLANLTLTTGMYAGACEALFFIHPVSGDFLPLTVRPNNGSPLVYTPLDSANDWTLAKMLLNSNDVWHNQWYHLGAAHVSTDLVWMSGVRSFSEAHPVWGLIRRIAVNCFAYRIGASASLVNPGGSIEQNFAWNGAEAVRYSQQVWKSGGEAWRSNYLSTKLVRRGLLDCAYGPPLKSFPYYEDVSVIMDAMRAFLADFVDAYYASDDAITRDAELLGWFKEAAEKASIVDFPSSVSTRAELVDVLAHLAYLVSVLHGSLNSNSLSQYSGVLPMHPLSLYRPLPTEKGVPDLVPFLPDLNASVRHITLLANFNQAPIVDSSDSMLLMFDDPSFKGPANDRVRAAAARFTSTLKAFGDEVGARKLDSNGLSQGMPFVWNLFNPRTAPGILAA